MPVNYNPQVGDFVKFSTFHRDGSLISRGEGIVKEVNPRGNPCVHYNGNLSAWVVMRGPMREKYPNDTIELISRSVTLDKLEIGGRFLYENKVHIKTDLIPNYADTSVYCVEMYAGKLKLLHLNLTVERSY